MCEGVQGEGRKGLTPVWAVTKPVTLGSICLDKVSVPKMPAGFRESTEPPASSPCPRWVVGVCAAGLHVLVDMGLHCELSESSREGVFLSFFNPHLLEP